MVRVLAQLDGALFAHPLTKPYELPASPVVLAYAAAMLVLLVGLAGRERQRDSAHRRSREVASWAGSLSRSQIVTRAVAVALLFLIIAAGRLGEDDELENLAPALVVGVAWPLLVVASILAGPVWRWIDPWDAIARALVRDDDSQAPGHVWPAALVAAAWVWYLSAYSHTLSPRSVGTALAAYSLLTVGGCLALGRVRWLAGSEPLGIVLSWMALVLRRGLGDWAPPRGASALLGVLAGGLLFGAARRSELWGELNTSAHPDLIATAGLIASCAVVAGLLLLMEAATAPRARQLAARAMLPVVAGVIVAVALERNRLTTSAQLLPGLVGDPFGSGWDLLGRAGAGLDAAPLGVTGLMVVQLAVLLAGFVAGAMMLARHTRRRDRIPVAGGLSMLASVAVVSLVTH